MAQKAGHKLEKLKEMYYQYLFKIEDIINIAFM